MNSSEDFQQIDLHYLDAGWNIPKLFSSEIVQESQITYDKNEWPRRILGNWYRY